MEYDFENGYSGLDSIMPNQSLRTVLHLVSEGRFSIGRGAELLGESIWDMHRLAQKHGVELGATEVLYRESHELVKRIVSGEVTLDPPRKRDA